jgi:hypothetical protein
LCPFLIPQPLYQPLHHKFSIWWINNENLCEIHSFIHLYIYTWMSCIENMFDTWINVLADEVWTYEWTNITQILHLSINICIKCVFNARYQCVKHMNYEWRNVTQILHLFINMCIKCAFNARYQCVKHTNYKWTNFAWFSLLNCKMLSLWLIGLGATLPTNHKLPIAQFGNWNCAKTICTFCT